MVPIFGFDQTEIGGVKDRMNQSPSERTSKALIRWGGLSLLVAGVLLLAFMGIVVGAELTLPVPAREILEAPAIPIMLFVVAAVGEILLVPGFLAPHLQMRASAAELTLLAVGFIFVAVAMFLVARPNIIGLALLSDTFANATDAERTSYLAAGALTAKIQDAISTGALLPLCVASLLCGVAMMLSTFPRLFARVFERSREQENGLNTVTAFFLQHRLPSPSKTLTIKGKFKPPVPSIMGAVDKRAASVAAFKGIQRSPRVRPRSQRSRCA